MAVQTSKLIVALVDHVTGPTKAIGKSIHKLAEASRANARRLDAVRGQMLGAAGAGYALYRGLSAPIKAAIEFESAMADVRKVVDFPTPKAFQQMGKDIRALSLQMPMTADGIAQIVAAAGQSGIANQDLLKFAEMAAKVGVAWDMAAGETGDALAQMKTALHLSIAQTGSLADAINYLGNNTAASAPALLDFTKNVAPMTRQFGLSAEQAAAFGAAMIGSGFEASVASTSFLNMGRALTRGASATKRQREAFAQLGLDATKVARSMQSDAVGTIQNVLSRIRALPKALQAAAISDVFGNEARALAPLITNAGLLGETLGYVADQTKYAGSAQAEYQTRSETTENSLQLFQNRVTELARSIGDALLPALNQIIGAVGPIVTSIADLAQRFPRVTKAIVMLVAGIVAFRVAAIAGQFAGLFLKGAVLDMGIAALRAARLMIGLVNPINLVTGAFRVLKLALIGTGIGAIIVAIAAAGTWIYQNWSGISEMFRAFGAAFMEALGPVRPILDPVIEGIKSVYNWVKSLLGPIDETGEGWRNAGQAAGEFVGNVVRWIAELPAKITALASRLVDAGKALIQSLWDGAKQKFDELIEWVKGIPARIVKAIGNIDLGKIIKMPSLPSWLGGGGNPAVAGARAAGGPVRAGGAYLVGEKGPEIVTFARDAFVHNAATTARIMRNAALASAVAAPAAAAPAIQSGSISVSAGAFPITIHAAPGQSPQEIAEAVERVLSEKLTGLYNGAFNDGVN